MRLTRHTDRGSTSVYGLEHGRLHVDPSQLPMWMNMGYWRITDDDGKEVVPNTLAVASRALLSEVLKTAGFSHEMISSRRARGERVTTKTLLDLGFGCGDQTVYLMSSHAARESDTKWWDHRRFVPRFQHYVGITKDAKQQKYAELGRSELIYHGNRFGDRNPLEIRLFCADAANPLEWSHELKQHLHDSMARSDERWILALDTLYHFSPSRWPIISYASNTLKASIMGFDLCLANDVSLFKRVTLRVLTTLMGSPWANFVTQDQYGVKMREAGYENIEIRDVSEHVFGPLAAFLEEQDRRLRVIGYGLGPFHLARWMFKWWARTGIVRGVIFVARH